MRRVALLATAVAVYAVSAWMVAPGFYDGPFAPPPYNWVSPPPFVSGNQPPQLGHADIKVSNGESEASQAFTDDGQMNLGFLPGVFDAAGGPSISVDMKPISTYPDPDGYKFVTNVYLVTASASLVKSASVDMAFSNVLPAPSSIYRAAVTGGAWKSIGANQQAQAYTINTSTNEFGYFAAGYPANSVSGGGVGSRLLPIIVAVFIVAVLLAGIPLAIKRRRRLEEAQ